MAQFEGSIKEFTKFIGAYARIKVMHISSKHKMSVGKCEECGLITKSLDAAHIRGKERPILISNILSQFIENGVIKMDLNEFEERFIEAHMPIEKTIRILCKNCHRLYDSKSVNELVPDEIIDSEATNEEKYSKSESATLEKLIKESMNKSKAIDIINKKSVIKLTSADTIFSNINAAKDVWWLELPNERFQNDLYFLLYNHKTETFFIFHFPANAIVKPENYFYQRNDRVKENCSKIYISVSSNKFIESKGFDFTKFLVESVDYSSK